MPSSTKEKSFSSLIIARLSRPLAYFGHNRCASPSTMSILTNQKTSSNACFIGRTLRAVMSVTRLLIMVEVTSAVHHILRRVDEVDPGECSPSAAALQFSVVERVETDALITVGTGPNTTRLLVWNNFLFDENNTVQVGYDQGGCTEIPHNLFSCVYTFKMDLDDEAQIMAQGTFPSSTDATEFAVVGGTGRYEHVVGTATQVYLDVNAEPPLLKFDFSVPSSTQRILIDRFSIVERSETDTVLQVGAGPQVDILIWDNPTFNANNTVQIGSSHGTCTQTPDQGNSCLYTFNFDAEGRDQIMAQGSFPNLRDPVEFAAVGGTGRYTGTMGTITLVYPSGMVTHFDYHFNISIPIVCPSLTIPPFSVIERSETDTAVKAGGEGANQTSTLIWDNPIFDENNTVQVGLSQGSCIQTPGGANSCVYTFKLDSGQIMAQGSFPGSRDPVDFAAIGGTGLYKNVTGTITLLYLPAVPAQFEYRFLLQNSF